ncbi:MULTISPECIES: bifunctional riboflavin kinase/FAD synthetase [Thermoanaerobacterium]|uniref:Riboflavin biosynthesis protein n=1 Tax=Thermoanaerobacterium butyriciformans TaxID=1702242 RepID=A0ABS4NJA3_9THEO|nr:bifunctional riboflavin kinase/FAD synthetase [Thermoanaerobacterium butyriciformans]MBP2073162.1 riboflavin kinase/FMN adenylyltransferase [Thermoanaerobacterium butyriciformans]WHE08127.1 bifunctional riboflavin kinase/FAD synthetase [Thermoanaerobacterium thermosaccharolyticum]
MVILDEYNIKKYNDKKVIALGNFDGIHLGHQELIKKAIELSKVNNISSSAFTFRQHTMKTICKKNFPKLLITNRKKLEEFSKFMLDYAIIFDFNKDFSLLSPENFIKDILIDKLNMKIAVVGENYRFGYKASGDIQLLKSFSKIYDYKVEVIEPVKLNKIIISSSYIRSLIQEGKIEEANKCLGRYFSLEGYVTSGRKVGRKLGFPTANISIDRDYIIPLNGVYLTRVKILNKYFLGITNVGINPTFNVNNLSVETYIVDFNENIYGMFIEVEFIKRIRDEIKFNSVEELIEQMKKDYVFAKSHKYILHN